MDPPGGVPPGEEPPQLVMRPVFCLVRSREGRGGRSKDATVYQKDATKATPATTEVKKDLNLVSVLSDACGLVG